MCKPDNTIPGRGAFWLRKWSFFKVPLVHLQECRFRLSWCPARWRLKEWNWWRRNKQLRHWATLFFYFKVTMTTIFFWLCLNQWMKSLRNLECSPYMKEHGWLQTLLCVHPFVGEELPVWRILFHQVSPAPSNNTFVNPEMLWIWNFLGCWIPHLESQRF